MYELICRVCNPEDDRGKDGKKMDKFEAFKNQPEKVLEVSMKEQLSTSGMLREIRKTPI